MKWKCQPFTPEKKGQSLNCELKFETRTYIHYSSFELKKQTQPRAFYCLKNNVLRPLSNRLDRLIVCNANITTLN